TAKCTTLPASTLTPSRLVATPTSSPAWMTGGPQTARDKPFLVISAVTPERQVGSDMRTRPRILTCPAVGAVHDRATHALESDGGISSKLLTKPEAAPSEVHSWSRDSTAVHAERFVQVEP